MSVFANTFLTTPRTQGIKYAGSKLKLIPHILSLFDDIEVNSVFDGFAGTTSVSQAFAQCGFNVTSNDIAEWSYIFGLCYLKNTQPAPYYQELIDHLNGLTGYYGWFSKHYGGVDNNGSAVQSDGLKKPWQLHNTQKLDAIRDEIERLKLDEITNAVALTSLILAMDEVDNTLGHFSAYLRQWSARSYKTMRLKVPQLIENQQTHTVLKGDIFDSLKQVSVDFAYFDPPYGSNNEKMPPSRVRYASYYHIWASICKNDKPPVFGAALRRLDSTDKLSAGVFEEFRKDAQGQFIAVNAIEQLIKNVNARYIGLSYSSGGKATALELHNILNNYGQLIKTIEVNYKKNVMAEMKWTCQWLNNADKPNREFIFLLRKF